RQALAADLDRDLDRRAFLFEEDFRRVGHFQRQVFDVGALQAEAGGLAVLGVVFVGHGGIPEWGGRRRWAVWGQACSRGSRPPARSSAERSSKPPMWRSLMSICGAVRRPVRSIMMARWAGSRSMKILWISRTPRWLSSISARTQ